MDLAKNKIFKKHLLIQIILGFIILGVFVFWLTELRFADKQAYMSHFPETERSAAGKHWQLMFWFWNFFSSLIGLICSIRSVWIIFRQVRNGIYSKNSYFLIPLFFILIIFFLIATLINAMLTFSVYYPDLLIGGFGNLGA